jgi:metal transporter CNNM
MISRSAATAGRRTSNGYTSTRPAVLGLAKIIVLGLGQLSMTSAAPVKRLLHITEEEPSPDEPSLWIYLTTALILVLLGGAFSGLTIA